MSSHPVQFKYPSNAWEKLAANLTAERRQKLEKTAAARTDYLRLVVQDIHNDHNVSACLRSAEAFGIQNIDVVNLHEKFKASSVARGVEDWLSVRRLRSIEHCAEELKASGYKIAAGVPSPTALPLHAVPLAQPLAVVFGNEHDGIDQAWAPYIDYQFTIPMVGFVESLNISVSCAVTLYDLTARARLTVPPAQYHLTDEAQRALLCQWICRKTRAYQAQLDHQA